MGSDHQRPQPRRQSPAGGRRADSGVARGRHGTDKILSGEGAPHGILVNGMLVGLINSDQHVSRHTRAAATFR